MLDDPSPPAPTLEVGDVLDGRYRLDAVLGEGGIGQVFEATHLALGTSVAVKILRPELADTELLRKRFQREARALTELSHPHIVAVTDLGVARGTPYLVMEKVEGTPLSALLRASPLEPRRALDLLAQVLRAVAHAHERGLVHRDLKPGNIVVREVDGRDHATVLDFGLARYTGERGRMGTNLTQRGALIGTPAYMAPEQAAGGQADERADVYALGLLAYEMLTDRRPYLEKEPAQLLRAHLTEPVPPLEHAAPGLEVSDALERWVQRALAKDRADRFATAGEMLAALTAIEGEPARRTGPAARRPSEPPTPPDPTAETLPALAPRPLAPPPPPAVPAPATHDAVPPSPASVPSARSGDAPEKPAEKPTKHGVGLAAAALALAGIVGIAALAGAAGVIALLRAREEPSASVPARVVPPPEPRAPERAPPPAPSRPSPMEPLPAELAPIHARVLAGRPLDRAAIGELNRYNRAHPDDPRGHLLLARHFTEVRSLSWAYPEYELALALDPEARHWPPVLGDLLEMVRSESLHREAVGLIVRGYGAEAVEAARSERDAARRSAERQRLDALLAEIAEP